MLRKKAAIGQISSELSELLPARRARGWTEDETESLSSGLRLYQSDTTFSRVAEHIGTRSRGQVESHIQHLAGKEVDKLTHQE